MWPTDHMKSARHFKGMQTIRELERMEREKGMRVRVLCSIVRLVISLFKSGIVPCQRVDMI